MANKEQGEAMMKKAAVGMIDSVLGMVDAAIVTGDLVQMEGYRHALVRAMADATKVTYEEGGRGATQLILDKVLPKINEINDAIKEAAND